MTSSPRTGRRLATFGVALAMALTGVITQTQDQARAAAPDLVTPLSEYSNYWTPVTYDPSTPASKAATAWHGNVTDAGAPVLAKNDQTLLAINHKGQADTTQSQRALIDADYDWKQTVPDSLGPVLGRYFTQGVENGKLPLTSSAMDQAQGASTTGEAKTHFNYPRPFLADRSFGGHSDLKGLAPSLAIHRVADWTDPATGKTHSAEYQELQDSYSQSFPSGHTTFAYQAGIQLAMLIPELGPEALARSSEAGNNRIVLGVHYPLDVIGGRIAGHINASSMYATDSYVEKTVVPARKELSSYLTSQCKLHHQGNTLESCIKRTGANDAGGYTNAFTDAVSRKPVTDRASALRAYQARITYGFGRAGAKGQAARVPAHAEELLATAFPDLSAEQRRAVLAATESSSGAILDSSSAGWQRINLPAAMSAKVTLDARGRVVRVQPGQSEASVVREPKGQPCAKVPWHPHPGHRHGQDVNTPATSRSASPASVMRR